jgi:hypothetical protein
MTESKKAWLEPELIVLVRNKPEEAVLSTCKADFMSGYMDANVVCNYIEIGCTACPENGSS